MIGPKDKPEKKGEEEKKKSRTSIKSLSDRISQAPIYKSNNNRPIDRRRAVIDWTRVIDHTKLGKRALRDAPLSVTHGTSSNVKKKTCKTIKKGEKTSPFLLLIPLALLFNRMLASESVQRSILLPTENIRVDEEEGRGRKKKDVKTIQSPRPS